MIRRRIAIFSGFDSKVVESIRLRLEKSQFRVVLAGTVGVKDNKYFDGIVKNVLYALNQMKSQPASFEAILFSCLVDPFDLENEAEYFFPALRRIQINPRFKRDVPAAGRIIPSVTKAFSIINKSNSNIPTESLLPLRNSNCPVLVSALRRIYNYDADTIAPAVRRYVARVRGTSSLKIGALMFRPAHNDETHPVRRTSDQHQCDLNAIFRLGLSVAPRFEFDVTSSRKWSRHQFFHCDGRSEFIPNGTSHVNMRINGDFECG